MYHLLGMHTAYERSTIVNLLMAMRVSRCDTLKLLSQWSVTKDCGTVLSESELLNKTRDGQRAREDADEDGSMAWSVERSKLERRRRQVKYVFLFCLRKCALTHFRSNLSRRVVR